MVDPFERHLLYAVPWLAAFVALTAAHVEVVRELEPSSTPSVTPTAPLVDIDVDVDVHVQSPAAPATAPAEATVITMDAACTDTTAPALAPELLFGVRQRGPTHFEVDRLAVDRILSTDLEGVRMVPAVHDGRPSGLKLFGVRACSPLGLLGLRNGDLLVRVDGEPIRAVESTLAPSRRLPATDHVTVDIVRRGQPLSLVYEIR